MNLLEEYKIQSFLNKNFNFSENRHSFLSIQKNNSPFSEEELSFIRKIKHLSGDMPKDYFEVVNKIKNQLNSLVGKLRPLYEIGLMFNIYLVGGSLRDLLLNNQEKIRDLDIVFDFSEHMKHNSQKLSEISVFLLNKIFGEIISTQTEWEELDIKQKSFLLVFHTLKNNYEIEKVHTLEELKKKSSMKNESYSHLLNKELEAVVTLSPQESEYPMDILVINSQIENYLSTFSFGICKVYLPVINMSTPQLITSIYDFMSNINISESFVKDAMRKKLTLKMYNYNSIELVEKILSKHYEKIKYKYDEFQLYLDPGNNEEMKSFKKNYESFVFLKNNLPSKNDIIVEKHIKI